VAAGAQREKEEPTVYRRGVSTLGTRTTLGTKYTRKRDHFVLLKCVRWRLQGTFEHSQGTFGHSQGTFGHSQGTFGHSQGTFGHSQGTFGQSGNIRTQSGSIRTQSGDIWMRWGAPTGWSTARS
jgi:hypothetical protein